ncbi:hypothetical protein [Microbulbifer litoralis]|uniref:hypothetical protein n=1 Tax=Microbulbifer litoralis TaxID=2933965 RepID=UPI0020287C75|nr:hypothetical protein [Microbulbifer sp. GX H0434]
MSDQETPEPGSPLLKSAEKMVEKAIDDVLRSTAAVRIVEDPYSETDVGYLVVTLNPCRPLIREVRKGTPGSYKTLVDAKEAARQAVQGAIAEANTALQEIRQLGIDDIDYISL